MFTMAVKLADGTFSMHKAWQVRKASAEKRVEIEQREEQETLEVAALLYKFIFMII